MIDQARAERIAEHIFAAHQRRARFERLRGELAPASLDEAYVVQDAVHRRFAEAGWGPLGGHKIALTSRAVQELCGVDQPAGGAIFARTIHARPRPSRSPASCISASSSSSPSASAATCRRPARPTTGRAWRPRSRPAWRPSS